MVSVDTIYIWPSLVSSNPKNFALARVAIGLLP